MPSSIPIPARSTGTTSGTGPASLTPSAGPSGVVTVTGRTRISRLASPASGVPRHGPSAYLRNGLVGEQGYRFVGQTAERGGLGGLLPQHGELVRNQWMI